MKKSICTVKKCPCYGRYCRNHEIWAPIHGFPKYEVSNFGRVRSLDHTRINPMTKGPSLFRGRILKLVLKSMGYCYVTLHAENKKVQRGVHVIVATAFIPNPENKPCVNHKEGNKADNREWMLEWCTWAENNLHAYRVLGRGTNFTGRSYVAKPVVQKDGKGNIIKVWESSAEAARNFNVHPASINHVVMGRKKTCKGFKFEHYEKRELHQ